MICAQGAARADDYAHYTYGPKKESVEVDLSLLNPAEQPQKPAVPPAEATEAPSSPVSPVENQPLPPQEDGTQPLSLTHQPSPDQAQETSNAMETEYGEELDEALSPAPLAPKKKRLLKPFFTAQTETPAVPPVNDVKPNDAKPNNVKQADDFILWSPLPSPAEESSPAQKPAEPAVSSIRKADDSIQWDPIPVEESIIIPTPAPAVAAAPAPEMKPQAQALSSAQKQAPEKTVSTPGKHRWSLRKTRSARKTAPAAKKEEMVSNVTAPPEPLPAPEVKTAPEVTAPLKEIPPQAENKPSPDITAPVNATVPVPLAPVDANNIAPPVNTVPPAPAAPVDANTTPSINMSSSSIGFDPDSSTLSPAAKQTLDSILGQMNAAPDGRMEIRAYAVSADGNKSTERRLSLARGLEIRSYLTEKGISPTRLDVRALGSETDISPKDRVDLSFPTK